MGGYRLLLGVAGVTLLMGLAMVLLPGVTLQAFGLMIYRDAAAMPVRSSGLFMVSPSRCGWR